MLGATKRVPDRRVALLSTSLDQLVSANEDNERVCSICLGALSEEVDGTPWRGGGPIIFAPCVQMVHVFHKACIKQHIEARGAAAKCPDCQSSLQPNVQEVLGMSAPQPQVSARRDGFMGERNARELELERRRRVAADRARNPNPQAARRWWVISLTR